MLSESFFTPSAVNKRTIKLADGTEHELYFRKVSSYDYSRFLAYAASKVPEERAEAAHVLVAASLCEADGKPALTVEKARTLKSEALDPLFAAAMEVNKREPVEGNA
ncbi:hypothetical protein [Cupriavidus gilardii]|uniref:hypothetical protein n=1 Tax=Cupriavidus gilardii TaxID=82541 RepID=UPI0021B1C924|nr:hypothetical protein [Cupriavidus gilardii]UXC34779.1 hypothetical protein N4G38_10030 [Cupriavidus gilardii]UXC37353.1 hypothetical protein N4G38_07925 [Cupriavidus gilardii]